MNRTQPLYQLQALDSELGRVNHQLAEVTAKLGETKTLKKAQKAVEVAEDGLHKAQATMQDLDLEVKGLSEKISHQEDMLYGGKALSAREAANLQDEIDSLKRWHSKREELLLEAMVEVEEAEERLGQAQAGLSTLESEWQADQEQLKQTQRALEAKIAELLERRPIVASLIDEDDLRIYESLRSSKGGVAIAAVANGVCQGCGMTASNSRIQQARSGEDIVYCDTCGRILYVP